MFPIPIFHSGVIHRDILAKHFSVYLELRNLKICTIIRYDLLHCVRNGILLQLFPFISCPFSLFPTNNYVTYFSAHIRPSLSNLTFEHLHSSFCVTCFNNVYNQGLFITKTCLFKYTENFTTKKENFQIKNSDIFHVSAQNIDCWYSLEPPHRGGSNEYRQSMFLSRNKENNVYPCKLQFYYIKVGLKGVKII